MGVPHQPDLNGEFPECCLRAIKRLADLEPKKDLQTLCGECWTTMRYDGYAWVRATWVGRRELL